MNVFAHALIAVLALPQDTVIMNADGPGIWGETMIIEEVVIGSLDGPVETSFGMLGAVALGMDSTIFVADIQVPVIRRFSLAGEYLGDVGRVGQGPGEYRQVLGLEIDPDGLLATWDPGNQRVSLFHPDASFTNSFQVSSGLFSSYVFQAGHSGAFYVKTVLERGERQDDPWTFAWLRISPAGVVTDTLPVPPENSTPSYVMNTPAGPRHPFPTSTVSAMGSDGSIIWARTNRYSVFKGLGDGRVMRIERSYAPVVVKRGERAQWEEFNDYVMERSVSAIRPRIPNTKPALRAIQTDDMGRIWVDVYAEAHEVELSEDYIANRQGRPLHRWRERPEWDVFEPDGRFLGRVVLPPRTYPVAVRGNRIIGTRRGDWDEYYVVVMRLKTEESSRSSS